MKSLSAVVLGVAVLGLSAGAVRAQDDYVKKIVGTWVIDKSSGDLPPGTTIEFTKDLKLTASIKEGDKELKITGTYKVEKDKLSVSLKVMDQTIDETVTITKLTDDALELKD